MRVKRLGSVAAALAGLVGLAGCSLVGPAPVADFDVAPVVLYAGEPVTLDASATSGEIVEYSWTLGSGAAQSGREITTTFAVPGVYSVGLSVVDQDGRRASMTQELTVYVRSGTRLFTEDFSDGSDALGRWALDPEGSEDGDGHIAYAVSGDTTYCLQVHSPAERFHRRGAAIEIPPLRVGQRLSFSFTVMTTDHRTGYAFVIAPARRRLPLPAEGLPYYVYSTTPGTASMREPTESGEEIVRPVQFKPSLYQWHTYVLTYSADEYTLSVDGERWLTQPLASDLSVGGTSWSVVGDESPTEACAAYYGPIVVRVEE
ncbi:MAG: PKD domain-containing protein [Candidatus Bipolaricaulis sp.]|nr:PKD domain-containing protein [Candidatus Bipolaricaulis sp.]